MGILDPVFQRESGYFTSLGGLTSALYEQHTEVNDAICHLALSVLGSLGIEHFLFAGSMVGYARNGRMPPWMDDIDILIMPDQAEKFERLALPRLRACGFEVMRPHGKLAAGGYHILSRQEGWRRDVVAPFSNGQSVKVPWAQVDAFFARVNAGGYLENPGGWGLFHYKGIPVDWVMPGVEIAIGARRYRAFSRWRDDVVREYGDVWNNLVIATHDRTFLDLPGVPYAQVDAEFSQRLTQARANGLPSCPAMEMADHRPLAGQSLMAAPGDSLDDMVRKCLDGRCGTVVLAHAVHFFWAMDLKRLLPGVGLVAQVPEDTPPSRISHLSWLYDEVNAGSADFGRRLKGQIDEIAAVRQEMAEVTG